LIYDNPNLRSQEFAYLRDKMDNMFLNLLSKIKTEHSKFKLWVKTYGFGIEVMKFIKNLTENNFTQINGNYINPILNEMYSTKKVEIPKIIESEIAALQEEINDLMERTSDLYLKPGTRREKIPFANTVAPEIKTQAIMSKVVSDMTSISRLFDVKIASLKLIYRAS
jgi:hypothetical protein